MNAFLLVVSMFFGTVPLNRQTARTNVLIDYLWMILMPLVYLVCYLLGNFGDFNLNDLPQCKGICKLAGALMTHLGCFLYVTVHFFTLSCRKQFFLEFEMRLGEIDRIISACKKRANCKRVAQRNSSLKQLIWALLVGLFCFDIFYDVKNMYSFYGIYVVVVAMLRTFPFVAASTVQGQFVLYVSMISHRFEELNMLLEKINQECDKKNGPVSVFDIESDVKKLSGQETAEMNGKSALATPIMDMTLDSNMNSSESSDEDASNDNKMKWSMDGNTTESNLPDLFRAHDKILSLSVLTNGKFGAQCVPYMAACFVLTIFGIFLVTKVNFIVGGKDALIDYVCYMYVCWSTTTMIVAYLVLRHCCNTNGHSKQSAMTVHEIMQKKPSFMLGNDLYYNKMKSFTLQFLHWESYFQFNGIGLFALDYTFIFSTVSAATSYLIVLLQFDMTSILKGDGLI